MKKYVSILLLVIMLLSLTACVFTPPTSQNLATLDLQYDSDRQTLSWSEVAGAGSYRVTIFNASNNIELISANVSTLSYSCRGMAAGAYIAKVYANSGDSKAISKTASVSFQIPSPTNPNTTQPTEPTKPEPNTPQPEQPKPNQPQGTGKDIYLDENGNLVVETEWYYQVGSNADLVLSYADNISIERLAVKALTDSKYTIDSENKRIVIDKSFLSQFTYGAKIALRVHDNSEREAVCYLNFVQYLPYEIEGGEVTYTKAAATIISPYTMVVRLKDMAKSHDLVKAVCVDDKPIPSESITYSTQEPVISIRDNQVLQNLSVGKHKLQIYTNRGSSSTVLNVVVNGILKPYDVQLDADSCYPNIYITWKDDVANPTKHQVTINDQVYSSDTHPTLFEGTTFDATGLVGKGDTYMVTTFADRLNVSSSVHTMYVDPTNATEQKYLAKTYEFLGKTNNYYLTSKEELKDFMWYFIMHFEEFDNYVPSSESEQEYANYKKADIYFNFEGNVPDNATNTINEVIKSFPEALSAQFATTHFEGSAEFTILLKLNMSTEPTNKTSTQSYGEYVGNVGHYGKGRPVGYDDFKINKIDQTASMSTTFEMYMAMERGYRPTPVEGSNADRIYNKAKEVLRIIIDDNMDDFEKVHAIYDWLSNNVVYDHDLANSVSGNKPYDNIKVTGNNSFYAEGVFDDGVAVCNGIAIAFSILCRIEGIECYKILGGSVNPTTKKSVGHAWNKVKIGDFWYICDATWASYGNSSTKKEKHVEEYLFMTTPISGPDDDHVQDNRNIAGDYYAGDTNYNVYANTWYVTENGEIVDMVTKNSNDLKKTIEYLSLHMEELYGKKSEYRIVLDCNANLWTDTYTYNSKKINGWQVTRESHKGGNARSDIIFKKVQ